jgi:uncharacterized protein (TIGR00251 family)
MAQGPFEALRLTACPEGTLIEVKVVPGASRNRTAGVLGGRLKITVSRPAEKGAANQAVGRVLAAALGLRPHDVEITAGRTRPEKTLLVRGPGPEEIRRRLERC